MRSTLLQAMYFEARGKTDRVKEAQDKVLDGATGDTTSMLKRQASRAPSAALTSEHRPALSLSLACRWAARRRWATCQAP